MSSLNWKISTFFASTIIISLCDLSRHSLRIRSVRYTQNDFKNTFEISVADNERVSYLQKPKVAWLMSYPNSGTSFTMRLVARGSGYSITTNYGKESVLLVDMDAENITMDPSWKKVLLQQAKMNKSIRKDNVAENSAFLNATTNEKLYPSSSFDGPFLINSEKDLPPKYIMTKTHCGGRCNVCGPRSYLETAESFLNMCATGSRIVNASSYQSTTGKYQQITAQIPITYDPNIVSRAIHLVRNPFNNLVSNFHLERHSKIRKQDTKWLNNYPNDRTGFRRWCHDKEERYKYEERSEMYYHKFSLSMHELFGIVPCHSSFYTYAAWHNHTNTILTTLGIPSIILWYEEYETKFDESVKKLSEFLELPIDAMAHPFEPGKDYVDYFTLEERQNAMKLVHLVTNSDTWKIVERYQENVDGTE